jgi:hypothetical protein
MTDKRDKALTPRGLQRSSAYDMTVTQLFEIVPEDVEYEDIFHPHFWRHHTNIRHHSLIRLRHALGVFDVVVNVVHKVSGGLLVEFHSGRPPRGVDPYKVMDGVHAEALQIRVAPIASDGKPECRTQFLPKTQFRVLGLGGTEIQRDIATQKEAEAVLANYLIGLNLRNPTDDELLVHAKKKAAALDAAAREKAPV